MSVCVYSPGGRFCQDSLTEKTVEVLVQTRTYVRAVTLGSSGQPVSTRYDRINTAKSAAVSYALSRRPRW